MKCNCFYYCYLKRSCEYRKTLTYLKFGTLQIRYPTTSLVVVCFVQNKVMLVSLEEYFDTSIAITFCLTNFKVSCLTQKLNGNLIFGRLFPTVSLMILC